MCQYVPEYHFLPKHINVVETVRKDLTHLGRCKRIVNPINHPKTVPECRNKKYKDLLNHEEPGS